MFSKKNQCLSVKQRIFIEEHIVKKLRISKLLKDLKITRVQFKRARFGLSITNKLYFKIDQYLIEKEKQINDETDEIV